jgi:hypothetical protein
MCVGVTVWFGWGGVVSGCRLKHCHWELLRKYVEKFKFGKNLTTVSVNTIQRELTDV